MDLKGKSCLVVHPSFQSLGGAEQVALHVIQHLQQQGADVTVMSRSGLKANLQQEFAGLTFDPERVVWLQPPRMPSFFPMLLQLSLLHREARRVAGGYDLCVSTYGEINVGKRALQYIHHPVFGDRRILERIEATGKSSFPLQTVYDKTIKRIAKVNKRLIRSNITLVNSEFMGQVFYECYGGAYQVAYPAFRNGAPTPPSGAGRKQESFISVGRISADKHTHRLPDLFSGIAEKLPEATFTLVGRLADHTYYQQVLEGFERANLSVQVHLDVSRSHLAKLLAEHTFSVNPKPWEHYGIAALDSIDQGCIPFVHNSGGAVEVVGDERCWYISAADLAEKAAALAENATVREDVLRILKLHIAEMNSDSFIEVLDGAIDEAVLV